MGKLIGFLVKAGLLVAVLFVVQGLRGKQAEKFHDESLARTLSSCQGEASCVEVVNAHFETCYDQNHSSHRRGRYNREHKLDQAGFDACMAVARGMTQIAETLEQLEGESEAAPAENEELAALRAAVMEDGVIDEYEEEALAEAQLDSTTPHEDGTGLAADAAAETRAAEAAFEAEATTLGTDDGSFPANAEGF